MSKWVLALLLAVFIGAEYERPVPVHGATPLEQVDNILLIGWDGAQREHVMDMLAAGRLPELERLGAEGALVEIDIDERTDTKAGWTQILTGYNAGVTGVFSNGDYQPIPVGYTVFERLEGVYGSKNIATCAVIGKRDHIGVAGPQLYELDEQGLPVGVKLIKQAKKLLNTGHKVIRDGAEWLYVPGEPYHYTQHRMDLFENDLKKNDAVGERALELLRQHAGERFFFFVHLAEVDTKGHGFGENSAEYEAALENSDYWLGRLRNELTALGIDERTLVCVTADHGFDEGMRQHKDAPYVFMAMNDSRLTKKGMRRDVTPTLLDVLGVDLGQFDPPLDGVSLLGK